MQQAILKLQGIEQLLKAKVNEQGVVEINGMEYRADSSQ